MKKEFDCVEMKHRLQEEMRSEEGRGEAAWEARKNWLQTGDDVLARWWRALPTQTPREAAVLLREEPAVYPANKP